MQEKIQFNQDNNDKMDLEFLLDVASEFPGTIKKCNHYFGVFYHSLETKTHKEQTQADYWRPDNFQFLR